MDNIKFKDVAGFYLGCEVSYEFITRTNNIEIRIGKLVGIWDNDAVVQMASGSSMNVAFSRLTPRLRPLSDMTEEEYIYIADFAYTDYVKSEERAKIGKVFIEYNFLNVGFSSHAIENSGIHEFDFSMMFGITRYLLSKHFDLFNLIESNQAIQKQ